MEVEAYGYAARDKSGHMAPHTFRRRPVGPDDVKFTIKFCGVCHSDWSFLTGEWEKFMGPLSYPLVPGHEIVGVVDEVGSEVTKFKVGDHVGVSTYVDSCRKCKACDKQIPHHCPQMVRTYGVKNFRDGRQTHGGYSNVFVVDQNFSLKVPSNLPLDGVAPLLYAGGTVWSPMKRYGMGKTGKSFAVVGLGGLGHIALKFAKAMGMHCTVISTSLSKEKMAREELGADNFIVSKDPEQLKEAAGTIDFIIDTVSVAHPIQPLLDLLAPQGTYVFVGAGDEKLEFAALRLLFGGQSIASSAIASQAELQEMLDFCGEKGLVCTIELISMDYIHEALQRVLKQDVHFRFVIDVENTLKPAE